MGTGFLGGFLCAKYGKSVLGCVENSFDKKSVEELANEIKADMGNNREQVIKTFERLSQKNEDPDITYVQKSPNYIKIPVRVSDMEKSENSKSANIPNIPSVEDKNETTKGNVNEDKLDKIGEENIKNSVKLMNVSEVKKTPNTKSDMPYAYKSKELSDILNEFKKDAEKELKNRQIPLHPEVKQIINELKDTKEVQKPKKKVEDKKPKDKKTEVKHIEIKDKKEDKKDK